ncbi:sialate O-acetylesterase [Viscerimonas tarda]
MKMNTLKLQLCFVLFCISLCASANDIYLSSSGNNSNDGLTAGTAVATLTKALDLIPTTGNGHIIKVSGFIDISKEVSNNAGILWNKKVYFSVEGDSKETSGFDGGNATRIINFQDFTGEATFKSLTIKNGSSTEGAAIRVANSSGTVALDNCIISNNSTTTTGTLHVNKSNVNISNSEFTNNKARQGGAVYANADAKLNITSSLIADNDLSSVANSTGGAIFVTGTNGVSIDNCIIKNNKALNQGGAIVINGTTAANNKLISITNTLIAANETVNSAGGGIFINDGTANNTLQALIVNSTLYKNLSNSYGGGIFVSGGQTGSSVKLVNTTIAENQTRGNGGHGAGINFRDSKNLKRYIYNCILEDNTAINGGNTQYGDITSNYNFNDGAEDFFLRNSYIGQFVAGTYTDSPEYNNKIRYGATKLAGLATPGADYIASQNSIPLNFDSDAIEGGDAKYLRDDLGISTDQLGNVRAFVSDRCAIGAVEVSAPFAIEPDPHTYEHFIIYGQSLSIGDESYYSLSTNNVAGNYMIGDQVWINYGNRTFDKLNPLVSTSAFAEPRMGECPVTGLVNHLRLKQASESPEIDNRFIATSAGKGGASIASLSKGNTLYFDYPAALKAAYSITARTGSTITCPAIFWMQGETDAANETPKNDYKAALMKLKNDMQSDAKSKYKQAKNPVFYTYQCVAQKTREAEISKALLEVSNENEDVFCVGPVYPASDFGIHLDGNGYRWFGEMMAKVYYRTKVLGEDFKPLQPKELLRDASNAKRVIVKFLVPKLPLVLDTNTLTKVTDYGFEVFNNGVKQTISSVTIDGDCVLLTCSNNLSGKIEVSYAGTTASWRGHGNLRDSDDYPSFFNYENPDLKDGEGNFVFPHCGEKASLTPTNGFPKDANGQSIFGKPYPLYNFSVTFFYSIPEGEDNYEAPLNGIESGINSAKSGNDIKISQTGSTLQVAVSDAKPVSIDLFGISGGLVKNLENGILARKSYNLSGLTAGIYIVRVQSANETKVQKIILN